MLFEPSQPQPDLVQQLTELNPTHFPKSDHTRNAIIAVLPWKRFKIVRAWFRLCHIQMSYDVLIYSCTIKQNLRHWRVTPTLILCLWRCRCEPNRLTLGKKTVWFHVQKSTVKQKWLIHKTETSPAEILRFQECEPFRHTDTYKHSNENLAKTASLQQWFLSHVSAQAKFGCSLKGKER